MKFAKRVFLLAAVYGLIVLIPQYFLEGRISRATQQPMNHPEYFYGFIGIAIAWQIAFFLISRDPLRFRPLMIAAIIEKGSFAMATLALYLRGRLGLDMLGAGVVDLILGTLFVVAFIRTAPTNQSASSGGHHGRHPEDHPLPLVHG